MNSENFQPLRDEDESMLPEIISNSKESEVLQQHTILESEAVEIDPNISLSNVRVGRKCPKYFQICPTGDHPPGGCEHLVNC